ncbi:hypothetical protein AB0C27_40350 [Nonomuraea sp. NPDC048882]|uniref:hypothetical protein n=1 Tax=Nonomuraea sp. NPDC048882 TaxID=3154347 RepID=UPI0033EE3B87
MKTADEKQAAKSAAARHRAAKHKRTAEQDRRDGETYMRLIRAVSRGVTWT